MIKVVSPKERKFRFIRPRLETLEDDQPDIDESKFKKSNVKSFFDTINEDDDNSYKNNEDILKIADINDEVKKSRKNLMICMQNEDPEEQKSTTDEKKDETTIYSPMSRRISLPVNTDRIIDYPINEISNEHIHKDRVPMNSNHIEGSKELARPSKITIKMTKKLENDVLGIHKFSEFMKDYNESFRFNKGEFMYVNLNPHPEKSGFLKLKGTFFLNSYSTRFMSLKNQKLFIYKDNSMTDLIGCLDFSLYKARVEFCSSDKKKFRITPSGSSKTFTFLAETTDDAEKWIDAIAKSMISYENNENYNPKLVIQKNFWKDERIKEKDFSHKADTGDILLFKSKTFIAKLQRTITRCEYDHVALILRYSNGEIVMLEATGKEGVGLCRWRTFKKHEWHQLYHKILFRKLSFDRNPDSIAKMEKFVKAAVGKKYEVTPMKLLKKKAEHDEEISDNRTFFCSELIAACYKRLGLLSPDISSGSYWPNSFSPQKKLNLLNGAKFVGDYLLEFTV